MKPRPRSERPARLTPRGLKNIQTMAHLRAEGKRVKKFLGEKESPQRMAFSHLQSPQIDRLLQLAPSEKWIKLIELIGVPNFKRLSQTLNVDQLGNLVKKAHLNAIEKIIRDEGTNGIPQMLNRIHERAKRGR